jgi:CO/xanthine dehydrogenase Mo-binding subunit
MTQIPTYAYDQEADEECPVGARSIGEPPIIAGDPAIANAIYDAIGVRITSLPITAEKVLQALREQNGRGGRGDE